MAEPMQIISIVTTTGITCQLVVQVEATPPRSSTGRTGRMWVRGPKCLPVRAIASLGRARSCSGASALAGTQRATCDREAALADTLMFHLTPN
jgi:hypothetical protein